MIQQSFAVDMPALWACCLQVGTAAYERWATERPSELLKVKANWESCKRLYNPEQQDAAAEVPIPVALHGMMAEEDQERLG